MSQNENKEEHKCESCGSDKVVLTEEKNATPKCGGCGKSKETK